MVAAEIKSTANVSVPLIDNNATMIVICTIVAAAPKNIPVRVDQNAEIVRPISRQPFARNAVPTFLSPAEDRSKTMVNAKNANVAIPEVIEIAREPRDGFDSKAAL